MKSTIHQYDIRTLALKLRSEQLTKKEIENYFKSLKDSANNVHYINTFEEKPATTQESHPTFEAIEMSE